MDGTKARRRHFRAPWERKANDTVVPHASTEESIVIPPDDSAAFVETLRAEVGTAGGQ